MITFFENRNYVHPCSSVYVESNQTKTQAVEQKFFQAENKNITLKSPLKYRKMILK